MIRSSNKNPTKTGVNSVSPVVQKHIDDGIESLEQSTEVINSGNENIKERYMNNRDNENITGNINGNVSRGTNNNLESNT
jgi:hypothetical protein